MEERQYQEDIERRDSRKFDTDKDLNKVHSTGYYTPISSREDYVTSDETTGEKQNPSVTQVTSNSNYNQKKASSYHINRKTLVPSPHKLTITHARILKVFNELKSLGIDDYPNAVAVLFRVFIELSLDCFITNNSFTDSKLNVDSQLFRKIEAVAGYFEANGIMTKNELRPIRQMTASENQTQSVRTFHSYVHNKDVTPSSKDLKSAWDDIWPFIEQIWR